MDIAIIGVAGRFPEADDLSAFYSNLKEGRDSVRALGEERMRRTSLPVSDDYQVMGYLDNIDLFDHAFFKLSPAEAENMDPHQRLALELVYETLENAGYNPFSLAGSATAVYMADNVLEYYQLAEKYDPTLLTGNLNAITAGRIARFFDLRGEALMIDTSCSSSLVAIHHACLTLTSGDIDQAIVCGVKIRLFPGRKVNAFNVGIGSPDGKTRSYAAGAGGTGTGEAGGCILLKPLQKAIQDRDIVHAIIKGTAVNQDAALSGSLTAPSSSAQAEVLKKAWRKAQIDPCSITYIEGHGTATKLGDPIEVEGIDMAFSAYTTQKKCCALSSLKSNIGHTDTAAGIAGLIKALLSLRHKKLFPAVHFDKPNPFIDFENSHLFVNTVLREWQPGPGIPRRAGISSFGLSGTNCHVVLEEAPITATPESTMGKRYPFPISGLTGISLQSNIKKLKDWLTDTPDHIPEPAFQAVSYTLCMGRPHFPFRAIVLADSLPGLCRQLNSLLAEEQPITRKETLYFIFSHNELIHPTLIEGMYRIYPEFSAAMDDCHAMAENKDALGNMGFRIFSFQYALYNLLKTKGILTRQLLGEGIGEITIATITGAISLREAVGKAVDFQGHLATDLAAKCRQFIQQTEKDGLVMVELGPLTRISAAFHEIRHQKNIEVLGIGAENPDVLPDLFSGLYRAHYPFDWATFFTIEDQIRIELPTYAFDRKRCWIREIGDAAVSTGDIQPEEKDPVQPQTEHDLPFIKSTVRQAWTEVLKNDNIGDEDDYFNIGGHSLNGTQVLNRLNKILDLTLEMDDLFDHGTISDLSGHILGLLNKDTTVPAYNSIVAGPRQDYYPLTHAQRRFWVLDQVQQGLTAYNMPGACMINGRLDTAAFSQAFDELVQRHESLRTTFVMAAGQPCQQIGDGHNFSMKYTDWREVKEGEEMAMASVQKQAAEPFDLANGPLIKAALHRLENDRYLFFYSLHHIIADGWSMEILVRDVLALYDIACHPPGGPFVKPLDPLKIQYSDYVGWLQNQLKDPNLSGHKEYWLAEFKDVPPSLELETDFPRPARQTFNGDKVHLFLDGQISNALKTLSGANGCTPFMTMLACINVLLCQRTRQYDMVIGTPVSGRTHRELEDLIGLFLNTLPLRLLRHPDETFTDILQTVKDKVLRGAQHQLYPFDCLLEDLAYEKRQDRNSLFDVGFTYNTLNAVTAPGGDDREEDLVMEPVVHGFRSVKADWWFHLAETHDRLLITLDYNTDLFLPVTANRVTEDLEWLIGRIIAAPDTTLRRLVEDLEYRKEEQKLKSQSLLKKKNVALLRSISGRDDQNPTNVF